MLPFDATKHFYHVLLNYFFTLSWFLVTPSTVIVDGFLSLILLKSLRFSDLNYHSVKSTANIHLIILTDKHLQRYN